MEFLLKVIIQIQPINNIPIINPYSETVHWRKVYNKYNLTNLIPTSTGDYGEVWKNYTINSVTWNPANTFGSVKFINFQNVENYSSKAYKGILIFTITASDCMDYSDPASIKITIYNNKPNSESWSCSNHWRTIVENGILFYLPALSKINDPDASDVSNLNVIVSSTTYGTTKVYGNNRKLNYTSPIDNSALNNAFSLNDKITYSVFDGLGYSTVSVITIIYNNSNPVATNYKFITNGINQFLKFL
jgi:hypothetical protein